MTHTQTPTAGLPLLRFWGRDAKRFADTFPLVPNEDGEVYAVWFRDEPAREAFMRLITDECIVRGPVDNDHAHLITRATVTLRVNGKDYTYSQSFGFGYPESAVHYMYEMGNYSCNCNRRQFIQQECDATFEPDAENCGDDITLVSLVVSYDGAPS